MELRQIETFYWIATLGSFSAAANRLHTTQPAISNRISTLEQELGVALFDRSVRQIQLTAEGMRVLDYATRILALAGDLRKAAAGGLGVRGTVRLGVVSTIAHAWLPRLIKQVHEQYPAIDVDFSVETTARLRERLSRREVDITITSGEVIQPGIENRCICAYSLEWIASSEMHFRTSPVRLSEIAEHRVITYPRKSLPYNIISDLFERHNVRPRRLLGSNSVPAMVQLAVNGVGVCAIPSILVAPHLVSGDLQILRTEAPLPALDFFVSYWVDPRNEIWPRIADAAEQVCQTTLPRAAETRDEARGPLRR